MERDFEVTVQLVRWEKARAFTRTSASELLTRAVLATSTHTNSVDLRGGLWQGRPEKRPRVFCDEKSKGP